MGSGMAKRRVKPMDVEKVSDSLAAGIKATGGEGEGTTFSGPPAAASVPAVKRAEPTNRSLDLLLQNVRVVLIYDTSIGIALSNDSGRWGKTLKCKILGPPEARALAVLLNEVADLAERNRDEKAKAEAVTGESKS
jgi:pyruvate/2-oxoglutarate dehydrogenase complex dihydrolipoamide acyltransferase (E2) component